MAFVATELEPRIGTRVEADTGELLSGARTKEIRDLLAERAVLVFPRLNLTDDQLRVVHSFGANQRINDPVPSYRKLLEWRSRYPHPRLHPMVWHHRNGHNSLAIGTTSSHVDGMSLDDGRLLLAKLLDWATQPHYVYSHDWEVGDLGIYDNTAVLHRVVHYAADSGRLMHRTALNGVEGIG